MRRPVVRAFLLFVGLTLVLATIGGLLMINTGFSAQPEPGPVATFTALAIRNFAIGRKAKGLSNPVERSPEVIASGREHFADPCATCHANNGNGDTAIGRGQYPRPPDLRLARTQDLPTRSSSTSSSTACGSPACPPGEPERRPGSPPAGCSSTSSVIYPR